LSSFVDGNSFPSGLEGLELHETVNKREEGVIASETDITAGLNASTALTYEDVTCSHKLPVESLYTTTLRV
jgi:hypothetical protein